MAELEGLFADEPAPPAAVEAEDPPPSWRVRLVDCGTTEAADQLSSRFEGMAGVRAVVTASVAVVVACRHRSVMTRKPQGALVPSLRRAPPSGSA